MKMSEHKVIGEASGGPVGAPPSGVRLLQQWLSGSLDGAEPIRVRLGTDVVHLRGGDTDRHLTTMGTGSWGEVEATLMARGWANVDGRLVPPTKLAGAQEPPPRELALAHLLARCLPRLVPCDAALAIEREAAALGVRGPGVVDLARVAHADALTMAADTALHVGPGGPAMASAHARASALAGQLGELVDALKAREVGA